jgi:hypothetical protein
MTLAAILVFYFLALGPAGTPQDQAAPAPQTQTPPAQKSTPSSTDSANSTKQKSSSTIQAKPKARHKKITNPCDPSASTTKSNDEHGGPTTQTAANVTQKPCPPPKKVVVNGGSKETTVNLNADTSPEKASDERSSAEQLSQATEDNLKKIAGKPLSSDQQEMVNQIKQFMDQSKAAVAEGDLERGRNLAEKARLLSDELVKP